MSESVSEYWKLHGKGLNDRRSDGRTFLSSTGTVMCNECCHGDRCDDSTHSRRDNCRYCLGSGYPAMPSTEIVGAVADMCEEEKDNG